MALRQSVDQTTVQRAANLKPLREPRDERVRVPNQRARPAPIKVSPIQLDFTPLLPDGGRELIQDACETPRHPDIVDLAVPSTWPRRVLVPPKTSPRRKQTPSFSSKYSTQASEVSFGILDYYTRDPSPLQSPVLPSPPLVLDPAIKHFNFGLSPPKPVRNATHESMNATAEVQTDAGAERPLVDIPLSPPPRPAPVIWTPHKKTYSLFPAVLETICCTSDPVESANESSPSTTAAVGSPISHQPPGSTYRPRKESLTSSIRSRKDSFTSFRCKGRIPLRILSRESTLSEQAGSSPHDHSRWSDDTITSPVLATAPGPRTSFGSLLGRESAQYPACFFDDDDDDDVRAPLRSRLCWQRGGSSAHGKRIATRQTKHVSGLSLGKRIRRFLLCGCGGS